MTALNATPAAQNLLAEPAPQTGRPGPVTLVIGGDFAGLSTAAGPHHATGSGQAAVTGKGKAAASATGGASPAAQATVQSRNAGASICSGLPQANPNPGVP